MRISSSSVLAIGAGVASLAGCGGPQPPIGAPESSAHRVLPLTSYQVLWAFGHHTNPTHDRGGANPWANLINVNGTLYGTTYAGGTGDEGTVYSISTAGQKKTLYRFLGGTSDGARPLAGLVYVKGALYGAAYSGGSSGNGVVFSITPAGAETVLYNFQGGSDGAHPRAPLIDLNGTLYGTTEEGGGSGCYSSGCGTVYSITTSGQESVLYRFQRPSDGAHPHSGLIAVKGTLYGTTRDGGQSNGCGTVFKVTTSGSEKLLHSFNCYSDGAAVWAPLVNVNGTLYGTTEFGGASGNGTIFSISTNGSLKVLYNFSGGSDGATPLAGLVYRNGTFYGTTLAGGDSSCHTSSYPGCGTVFSVDPAGSEKVLYSFKGGSDGVQPTASLVSVNGTLYGTTIEGGGSGCHGLGCGIVFAISP